MLSSLPFLPLFNLAVIILLVSVSGEFERLAAEVRSPREALLIISAMASVLDRLVRSGMGEDTPPSSFLLAIRTSRDAKAPMLEKRGLGTITAAGIASGTLKRKFGAADDVGPTSGGGTSGFDVDKVRLLYFALSFRPNFVVPSLDPGCAGLLRFSSAILHVAKESSSVSPTAITLAPRMEESNGPEDDRGGVV